jgi:hypothetical protein
VNSRFVGDRSPEVIPPLTEWLSPLLSIPLLS